MNAGYGVKRLELLRAKSAGHNSFKSQTAAPDDQRLPFVNYR